MVKSGRFLRLVDPATAMWNKTNSQTLRCEHSSCGNDDPDLVSQVMAGWKLESILEGWPYHTAEQPVITTILDSPLKLNIALGLSSEFSVIKDESCCLQCALNAINIVGKDLAVYSMEGETLDPVPYIFNYQIQSGTLASRRK
jgi:hypothetical protein